MSFATARERAGLSQRDVARQLDVDQSTVCSWEVGRQYPRASMLVKLADLYCCSIDELMGHSAGQTSA